MFIHKEYEVARVLIYLFFFVFCIGMGHGFVFDQSLQQHLLMSVCRSLNAL